VVQFGCKEFLDPLCCIVDFGVAAPAPQTVRGDAPSHLVDERVSVNWKDKE
jgi:hypothetical protein